MPRATPADLRKHEEGLVKDLLASPVWEWLKPRLELARDQLCEAIADPRLGSEQRALAAGRLGLVVELLNKPEKIMRLAENTQAIMRDAIVKGPAPRVVPD